MKKAAVGLVFLLAVLPFLGSTAQEMPQVLDLRKAKIFQETYPLLTETDFYCSIFMLDGLPVQLRIAAAEREEKLLLNDGDIVYLKAGRAQGLAVGEVFLVVEVGAPLVHPLTHKTLGQVCFRRGRAEIIHVEEDRAAARLMNACGPVPVGAALLPFEVKTPVVGKDEGFVPYAPAQSLKTGSVVYLADEVNQVSYANWVLIDLGLVDGLKAGQQLTIFHPAGKGLPRRSIGNGIVVHVQARTSTLKILSTDDPVVIGDGVEIKLSQ